jgi:cyclic beta-1,2-glucan synthetase
MPLTWIEQRLSESGLTIEQLVHAENQQQAADQVSISNSIGSLRFLGAMDWREFVETMSVVEQTLGEDHWRSLRHDGLRHPGPLPSCSGEDSEEQPLLGEAEVARKAIDLAHETAADKGSDDRVAHVGFYLIDKGLSQLERIAGGAGFR